MHGSGMRQPHNIKIILASSSPRRKDLLRGLGLKFRTVPADIDESMKPGESPVHLARRFAKCKAEAIAEKYNHTAHLIIAGDTIVVLVNRVLGKPKTKREARMMLESLSGKSHGVISGLCLIQGNKKKIRHEFTQVTMRPLTQSEIRNYVATGEPMDKAGAYGIHGIGATIISRIHGDYFNVVGLPLVSLIKMLKAFGIQVI